MTRFASLTAAALACSLAGCAAIWGVDAPIADDDGGSQDATTEASVEGSAGDATQDSGVGEDGHAGDATMGDALAADSEAPDATTSGDSAVTDSTTNDAEIDSGAGDTGTSVVESGAAETSVAADSGMAADSGCGNVVDVTNAVLVYGANGMDTATCGTLSTPCKTIKFGISQALGTGKSVYVAGGTYSEAITLAAGITIVGGFDLGNGGEWITTCNATPHDEVIVQAPDSPAVLADQLGGVAQLQTLTVKTVAVGQPGESLYGVFARGTTGVTRLNLIDVAVISGTGGIGTNGGTGDAGAQGSGTCAPGDAGPGVPNGVPGSGADAGWSSQGYIGNLGTPGGTGATGSSAPATTGTCETCVSCSSFIGCTQKDVDASCGTPGQPGCGGGGGLGGGGGGSGGTSVALFVWGGSATVTVTGGVLMAGNGGNGGNGGLGGMPGAGGPGTAGSSGPMCDTVCNGSCVPASPLAGSGGPAAQGGEGASGGQGGGGVGGSSYAIVHGGGASVTISTDTPVELPGDAGQGGVVGGASGQAGPTLSL
jgi:hypothetical protein